MTKDNSVKRWFGENLAELLSNKIKPVYKSFDAEAYIKAVKERCSDMSYSQRVALHADLLKEYLPTSYPKALGILMKILGDENPNEAGMFKEYYWLLPVGKFIEQYGLDDYDISLGAIAEITKRSTGEYAIRPYIEAYPKKTIAIMLGWSTSKNFHLRRLASEGARPKLPWAKKLDVFIHNPGPVFKILENLMEDDSKFVQKSVANNLTDYLKVNKEAAAEFIKKYQQSDNKHTQWILKRATRKIAV